jgi:uncharacterized protein YhaN
MIISIYRSESSTNDTNELKRIKTLISDLQRNSEESHGKNRETLDSMTSTITDLQSRFEQMETRFDRWHKEMKEVTEICFSSRRSLFSMEI